jgi:hypothetical protein
VITAGGISPLEKAFPVEGGSQGAPTMAVYWAIASIIMIKLANRMAPSTAISYKIKSNDDIIAIIQQIVFADDNLITAIDDTKI